MRNVAICAIVVIAGCSGCAYFEKKIGLPEDNIIEESVESVIQQETGLDIDLTPGSPEK